MKTRRVAALIASIISLAIVLCVAVTSYWRWKQPVFTGAPKLISAMQAFARDLTMRGQPLPATVTLRELVIGGYIAAQEVRAFDGMELTLSLSVDEAHSQGIVSQVRLPDGSIMASMADGSVQSYRKSSRPSKPSP